MIPTPWLFTRSMVNPMRRREALLAVAFLAWASAPGCGDGKPAHDTSRNEATVTGIVTARGQPVAGSGTIQFNASNSGRIVETRSAPIGADGRYTIKTYTGLNLVTYGGEIGKKYPGIGLRRDAAEVRSGENTVDFDILEGGKRPKFDVSKKAGTRKR
jgi:hypothetical protein